MKPMILAAIAALALPCAAIAQPGGPLRTGMEIEIPAGAGALRADLVYPKARIEGGLCDVDDKIEPSLINGASHQAA